MIQRFEDEYPETRIPPPDGLFAERPTATPVASTEGILSEVSSLDNSTNNLKTALASSPTEEDPLSPLIRPASVSRRTSSPNLASRQAQEEGRMHRFGQRIKRDILRPQTEDFAHGTTGAEEEPEHIRELRQRLEGLEGEEIKAKIERLGPEAALQEIETEGLRNEMGGWNLEDERRVVDEPMEEGLDEWRGRMGMRAPQISEGPS